MRPSPSSSSGALSPTKVTALLLSSEPCPVFEAHFWKRGKCKNCFFSKAEHLAHYNMLNSSGGSGGSNLSRMASPRNDDASQETHSDGDSSTASTPTSSSSSVVGGSPSVSSSSVSLSSPSSTSSAPTNQSDYSRFLTKKREIKEEQKMLKRERKELALKQTELREAMLRMEIQLNDYNDTKMKNDILQQDLKLLKQDLREITMGASRACEENERLQLEIRKLQLHLSDKQQSLLNSPKPSNSNSNSSSSSSSNSHSHAYKATSGSGSSSGVPIPVSAKNPVVSQLSGASGYDSSGHHSDDRRRSVGTASSFSEDDSTLRSGDESSVTNGEDDINVDEASLSRRSSVHSEGPPSPHPHSLSNGKNVSSPRKKARKHSSSGTSSQRGRPLSILSFSSYAQLPDIESISSGPSSSSDRSEIPIPSHETSFSSESLLLNVSPESQTLFLQLRNLLLKLDASCLDLLASEPSSSSSSSSSAPSTIVKQSTLQLAVGVISGLEKQIQSIAKENEKSSNSKDSKAHARRRSHIGFSPSSSPVPPRFFGKTKRAKSSDLKKLLQDEDLFLSFCNFYTDDENSSDDKLRLWKELEQISATYKSSKIDKKAWIGEHDAKIKMVTSKYLDAPSPLISQLHIPSNAISAFKQSPPSATDVLNSLDEVNKLLLKSISKDFPRFMAALTSSTST